MLPLTPETVLAAYRRGIFPMARSRTGPVDWYSPDPRGILPLDAFHVPASLAKVVRSSRFEVTADRDFAGVIDGCAGRDQTWISFGVRETYLELHRRGRAHSVEAWKGGELAGGLYGVHIAGAFMGESMFHRATDASKVCLVSLVAHLRARGFALLDIQQVTPITERFGGTYVSRGEYLRLLRDAMERRVEWGTWG
ncbi:MAG: leucyl/phenylalanyl-tRNA--protein transferase [Planctomycetes bacterium]|nr:leucyl/phenylalanyl-tRNA--protein transferase [Planctomycetota bacterium]